MTFSFTTYTHVNLPVCLVDYLDCVLILRVFNKLYRCRVVKKLSLKICWDQYGVWA